MEWFGFLCVFFFVCLEFIVPFETFSLIWRRHHCRWRAANFDLLCSALMAIEQWGFFSVPHLLWHGASVYNCHLRGSVTHTPITERLAAVSTCFYDLGLSLLGFEHPTIRFWGERLYLYLEIKFMIELFVSSQFITHRTNTKGE